MATVLDSSQNNPWYHRSQTKNGLGHRETIQGGAQRSGCEKEQPRGWARNLTVAIPGDDTYTEFHKGKRGMDDGFMRDTFHKYAMSSSSKGSRGIDIHGLSQCMHDFGLLEGRSEKESMDAIVAMFANLDVEKKNSIDMKEFENMWIMLNAPRLGEVVSRQDPEMERALYRAFCSWSTFGSPKVSQQKHRRTRSEETMGSSHWTKLCRDVGFVAPAGHTPRKRDLFLTYSDADIIFAKVKARGMRKINYSQFVDALGLVAEKLRKRHVMDVVRMVVENKPVLNGTVVSTPSFFPATARYNIFKRGLVVSTSPKVETPDSRRETVYRPEESGSCTMSSGRSQSTQGKSQQCHPHHSNDSKLRTTTSTYSVTHASVSSRSNHNDEDTLLHVYGQYASFGHGHKTQAMSAIQMAMSAQQFAKLCRECDVTGTIVPSVKVDLAFAKAKKPKKNCLMFEDFLVALAILASDAGIKEDAIYARVCHNTTGPRLHSPQGSQSSSIDALPFVRLHDDPSAQCGVYGRRHGPLIRR